MDETVYLQALPRQEHLYADHGHIPMPEVPESIYGSVGASMTWRDEILLREMERFEARDRKATGPRAAMPDDSPVGCNWQWGGPTDPNERDLETENRELRNQWQYLCGELKARSGIISNAIQARETANLEAARNRRSFRIASVIALIATAAAWAGWLR